MPTPVVTARSLIARLGPRRPALHRARRGVGGPRPGPGAGRRRGRGSPSALAVRLQTSCAISRATTGPSYRTSHVRLRPQRRDITPGRHRPGVKTVHIDAKAVE
jgi:hypothetical protein